MSEKLNSTKACVGIAAIIGGMSCGIVALFGVFAPESIWVSGLVVGALSLMGVALGVLVARNG